MFCMLIVHKSTLQYWRKRKAFYKYVRDIDNQIIFQKLTVVHKLPFISLIFIKKEPTHFSIKGKSRKKHKFVNLCYSMCTLQNVYIKNLLS